MTFKFLKTVLKTCRYAMCISLGVLSVSGTASATLIESIAALEEGAMYRVLFVNRDSTTANSLDIDDYNTFVSNAAGSGSVTGSLGLTWKALASTRDANALDNTGIHASDYSMISMFNTNRPIVASSGGSDLWSGSLGTPLLYTEYGAEWSRNVRPGTEEIGDTILRLCDNVLSFVRYFWYGRESVSSKVRQRPSGFFQARRSCGFISH